MLPKKHMTRAQPKFTYCVYILNVFLCYILTLANSKKINSYDCFTTDYTGKKARKTWLR